ncbi:MAG: hypothetical protein HYR56_20540 [Acidobacteria bacterium]|nr:hypothetical protein [Acidobacteriota bacterium]MBI3427715.1 hypothetical protein [Acidobacteriota bacterium]
MSKVTMLVMWLCWLFTPVQGQNFSSGSTGADGALDLTSGSREVELPESGILNYTTINVPSGRSLTFKGNLKNTPVILLAQGNVTITGSISVSARNPNTGPTIPGPGGFFGGAAGQNGFGPGGGQVNGTDRHGRWVGPLSLVPIIGGSSGAGSTGSSGASGGGAIVIASSTSITISGGISANGFSFLAGTTPGPGAGSGGAIRLVANTVSVSGDLNARGGSSTCNCHGVIRIETRQGGASFTGNATPPAVIASINPVIVPNAATPALTIVSIGGYPVTPYSGSRPDAVDLLLPNQLTDPLSMVVQASNIAVGTQVRMNISGVGSYTPGTLSGTLPSSTATLTIAGLNRNAATYLFVYATFGVPASTASYNPPGPDQVAQVRLEAAPGAPSKFVFLRHDGSEIDPRRVPSSLLQQFEP